LIARLQSSPAWPGAADRPLHQGLTAVAGQIRELAASVPTRPLPARAAFVGLPGVGCTTALCKWMAAEVFGRGRRGAVASIEFDRPKGAEDLAVFAELLGVDFGRELPATTTATGDRFCYADMPALSLTRPDENRRLRAFLDEQRVPGRVLVLSGLTDLAVLRQASVAGVDLGCTHLVFTQLDELPHWGKLWDFLIEAPLAPLMATCGPSLTGDCETDVIGAVLRRTFPWN
jgi:flagellar biosynthesis protein FlhF